MASDKKEPISDDLPSDFFDDFDTDMFIEGLSVIDSWNDEEGSKRKAPRIDAEAVESVKDLRELINESKDVKRNNKNDVEQESSEKSKQSEGRERSQQDDLEKYIKPGSRRDPSKTNEAIKKDKEIKVKEYLAKSIEGSSQDIRPPGTELDDFFDENKEVTKNATPKRNEKEEQNKADATRSQPQDRRQRKSPHRYDSRRQSPRPQVQQRRQIRRSSPSRRTRSPQHNRSAQRSRSPQRHRSPQPFRSQQRFRSPQRHRNPQRHRSPQRNRNPQHYHNSKRSPHSSSHISSPYEDRRLSPNRRHSPDTYRPNNNRDNFLYTRDVGMVDYNIPYGSSYTNSNWDATNPYTGYAYPSTTVPQPGHVYPVGYAGYQGTSSTIPPGSQFAPVPAPQPVPAPSVHGLAPPLHGPAPTMVPAPQQMNSPVPVMHSNATDMSKVTPYDALAQLLAEGKISKDDYLKLAPNKGSNNTSSMEVKDKVQLLSRCHDAFSKLAKLHLPNRLVMHNTMTGVDTGKSLAPKYCSPLKRQPPVVFHFTQMDEDTIVKQNKQLVESIISTIGLDKVVLKSKKRDSKNMKDVAVQTSKPFCDLCEIRESTRFSEAETSIDAQYFTTSVHTQVLEQDLVNSKALFNPSGSMSEGASMSIAHMTPAQLVSQLAARAKTLKQDPPPPNDSTYARRPPPNAYGYGHTPNRYSNNYNYRY